MRKILIFIITVATMLTIFGCASAKDDFFRLVEQSTYDIYEELKPLMSESRSSADVYHYISDFAEQNGIKCKWLSGGSGIILIKENASLGASGSNSDAKKADLTLQTSISKTNDPRDGQVISVILATLKNSKSKGKLSAIFTNRVEDNFIGAKNLPAKYLNTKKLINLTHAKKPIIYSNSAATSEHHMVSPTDYTDTNGKVAFKISISGLKGGLSYDSPSRHANPISHISNLMHKLKNQGFIIQIANFNGGTSANSFPKKSEITVLVDQSETTKLENTLKNDKDSYTESYVLKEPNMNYKITNLSAEGKQPTKAFSTEATAKILGLIYIFDEGSYRDKSDDKKIAAVSVVGNVRTTDNSISLGTYVRSLDLDVLSEINNSYSNGARLNDFSFATVDTNVLWKGPKNNPLNDAIVRNAKQVKLSIPIVETFRHTEISILAAKNNTMEITSVGTNIQSGYDLSKALILISQQ